MCSKVWKSYESASLEDATDLARQDFFSLATLKDTTPITKDLRHHDYNFPATVTSSNLEYSPSQNNHKPWEPLRFVRQTVRPPHCDDPLQPRNRMPFIKSEVDTLPPLSRRRVLALITSVEVFTLDL